MQDVELDEDKPIHIESTLDGADVLLLVETGRSRYNLSGWGAAAFVVGVLFLIDPAWYVVALVAAACPIVFVALTLPGDTQRLRFRFDPRTSTLNGRPFTNATVDYQNLTVDGVTHRIVGGLSKSEQAALDALLHPAELGTESDVPQSLGRLTERD